MVMTNLIKVFFINSFILLSWARPLWGADSFIEKMATENIKTIGAELDISPGLEVEIWTPLTLMEEHFRQENNPSLLKKRQLAFSLFRDYNSNNDTQFSNVIDYTTLQDLHLLSGPQSDPSNYLAKHVDRTQTEVGKVTLLHLLATPVSNPEELYDRQEIIKTFLKHTPPLHPTYSSEDNSVDPLIRKGTETPEDTSRAEQILTFDSLEAKLKQLRGLENHVLSILAGSAYAASHLKHKTKMTRNKNSLLSSVEKVANRYPSIVGAYERFREVQDALSNSRWMLSSLTVPLYTLAVLINQSDRVPAQLKNLAQSMISVGNFAAIPGLLAWLLHSFKAPERVAQTINGAVISLDQNALLNWQYLTDFIQEDFVAFKQVQIKLMALAEYIETMRMAKKLLESSPIKEKIPAFKKLHHMLIEVPQENSEFRRLLDLLQTSTFKGNASYFSDVGNILVTLRLVDAHEKELFEGIVALGEIDTYVSIASLFKERMVSQTRWCFPVYKGHESTPALEAKHFWNPFIDPAVVVTNTLQLGTPGDPRSAIITGPNAGGKSTAMTAIIYAALLSQTLGIAPAQEFVFTPFSKILTYLKITDDIAAGNSHFKAGAVRAQEVASALQNLTNNQWALTGVDEVFNGTTHREGEAAAYSFIEMLGNFPHNLCLTTTHFPLITNLEKETAGRLFKNYKVSVTYNEQGNLVYPFKLEPGISDQNIAFDVLKEEGFQASFLEKARLILAARKGIE